MQSEYGMKMIGNQMVTFRYFEGSLFRIEQLVTQNLNPNPNINPNTNPKP